MVNFLQSTGLQGSTGPTQITKGGMPATEQISREAPRVYQASSLEAGQEWTLERGQLGDELLPHCPKAPLRWTQIPSHPWPSFPQSLIFPRWSCRGRGSEPIKNGELPTHELKNIYKVLFLGSSLSFSTVQSRVVWGKVGKRTTENVL